MAEGGGHACIVLGINKVWKGGDDVRSGQSPDDCATWTSLQKFPETSYMALM